MEDGMYGEKGQVKTLASKDNWLPDLWARDARSQPWCSVEVEMGTFDGRAISNRDLGQFRRPFPALTPAQRLHLEFHGYVVVENVLTPNEVGQLCDEIYDLEKRSQSGDDLAKLKPAYLSYNRQDFFRIDNIPHASASFFDYLTHPRLVGMAEEIIGGPARLLSSHAHIRRTPAELENKHEYTGFHRSHAGMGETIVGGLYHYPFVHALTNLTDLEPDDGGTAVIAGSHKIPRDLSIKDVIAGAMADPSLIHHVVAPAGSTLLFVESLLHSSGIIRSGRDRLLIIGGYGPHMYAPTVSYEPSADLIQRLPHEYKKFFTGFYSYYGNDESLTVRSLKEQPPA